MINPDSRSILASPDLLLKIFEFLSDRQQLGMLSLVNRLWHRISSQSHLWLPLCRQTGVAVPKIQHAKEAYQYQRESLLLEKIRACDKPSIKETTLEIDLENYQHIDFVENFYVIAYNACIVCIAHVSTGKLAKRIVTESKILSSCATGSELYLFLANGLIEAYRLTGDEEVFLTINAYTDILETALSQSEKVQLLVTDEWLITHACGCLRRWDRHSGALLVSCPLQDEVRILQIIENKIFAISRSLNALIMIKPQMNECMVKLELQNLAWETRSLSLNHNLFSYTKVDAKSAAIVTINIDNGHESSMPLQPVGGLNSVSLKNFKDAAILVYHSQSDSFEQDFIEVIDLEAQKLKYRFSNHKIVRKDNHWSLAIFHDTILYATTDNKIVSISFASRNGKRKTESHETDTSRKKRKLDDTKGLF